MKKLKLFLRERTDKGSIQSRLNLDSILSRLCLVSLICVSMLTFGVGNVWGTDVTFTPGTDTGATSVTKSNVTCTMTTMNNSSYYQIYANQSGTFECSNGNITKIEFICTASGTSKYGPGNVSANVGSYSYSGNTGTWTGEATSVTLSSTAQVRMSSLSITYSGSNNPTVYLKPYFVMAKLTNFSLSRLGSCLVPKMVVLSIKHR